MSDPTGAAGAAAAAAPALVLDNTMGALLVGLLIATALWGVSCVQFFNYYNVYHNDPWYMRILIGAAFTSDTVHQILISHSTYTYLITQYGNPLYLGQVVPSLVVEVLFNGFTAFIVQSFFCFRIYKLSRDNKLIITGVVATLVLAEFLAVLIYFAKGIHCETFAELIAVKAWSISVNALAAAGDVAIALALCFILQTSRTGFRQSETMINKLMVFAVNTGLLTSICALLSLISITTMPNNFVYICFYFSLGRLYMNSLLATLNARRSLRGEAEHTSEDVRSVPLSLEAMRGGRSRGVPTGQNISIKIDTTKEFARDDDQKSGASDTIGAGYKN